MTRILEMQSVVIVLAAALVLAGPAAWSTDALAQGASPAASQPQVQPADGSMVEGKIVNVSGDKVTLADGTQFMIPSDVKIQRSDLRPGATLKVKFEERGGQKVVTSIAVEPIK